MNTWKQTITRLLAISIGLAIFGLPNLVLNVSAAPTHTSPNYGVDEVFFGSGGVNDANSANYNARASLGDLGVGNSASANFQAYGGFTTTTDPYIELFVPATSIDLGYLDISQATTTSATFRVRAWLADGYVVQNGSDGPINTEPGAYAMNTLATQTAPAPGTEQFGINLVANTSPATVGANPAQLPDATFSDGQVNTNYATANQYRYNKGDIIAFSDKSTSITEYTVTYMYNISEATPAGEYVLRHSIVATGTY